MPNPNPKTEQLALGHGKRPKLNHGTISMRMGQATRDSLEQIAESYNCIYGGQPWIAGLLEKIGSGELVVVPRPLYSLESSDSPSSKEIVKAAMMRKHNSSLTE
jgi:hypothetical protein